MPPTAFSRISPLPVSLMICVLALGTGGPAAAPVEQGQPQGTVVMTLVPSTHGNPEGIAFDARTGAFYVGAVGDGTIYRGTPGSDRITEFIHGAAGSQATGLATDRGLLYVAGGFSGTLRVYDLATRGLVASFQDFGAAMVNDLVVTPRGDVYLTDSFLPVLWHVTGEQVAGGGGEPRAIPVQPEIEWDEAAFNLTGIVALHGGRTLIVAQAEAGKLFRIDLDGQAAGERHITEIALDEPVFADGLLIDQGRLVAVSFAPEPSLTFVRLDGQHRSGVIEERRRDETFRDPSAIAAAGNLYLVVNADFTTSTTPFTVSALPRGGQRDR